MITRAPPWWAAPWFLALCLVLVAAPLAWPQIPPLTDLPGHLGRYRIAADLAQSPHLARFYAFEWALLPNLGVDLLMLPLARLLDIEVAIKLVALLIPVLTLLGLLWMQHGSPDGIQPGFLFAAPLILGYPFQYGFLNFVLSMALAFLAAGLWQHLARAGRLRWRGAVFVPVAAVVWVAHAAGWGTLGLLAFAFEFARQRAQGRPPPSAALRAALACLPLATPWLLALFWHSGGLATVSRDWFDLPWKLLALAAALRDRWALLDLAALAVLLAVLAFAWRSRRLGFAPGLALAAALHGLAFLALPQVLLGSSHADIRLAPYVIALALLAIRLTPAASARFATLFALAGLAFLAARIGANTASLLLYDRSYRIEARALDAVPRGARLLAYVGTECPAGWATPRLEHFPALAIVRREAFSNDQWAVSGSHLLRVKPPWSAFVDPTHYVAGAHCANPARPTLNQALAALPRQDFDYLWLLRPPPFDPALTQGWREVWRAGSSVLFALHPGEAAPLPRPGP